VSTKVCGYDAGGVDGGGLVGQCKKDGEKF
jgi:hypothetical protein